MLDPIRDASSPAQVADLFAALSPLERAAWLFNLTAAHRERLEELWRPQDEAAGALPVAASAKAFLELGWHLLPVWGKHPLHGTSQRRPFTSWTELQPHLMRATGIAVVTALDGPPLLPLDFDLGKVGPDKSVPTPLMQKLLEHGVPDHAGVAVSSVGPNGRINFHLYLLREPGEDLGGSADNVDVQVGGPGVTGRYLILPPSLHTSGVRYRWLSSPARLPLRPEHMAMALRDVLRRQPAREVTALSRGLTYEDWCALNRVHPVPVEDRVQAALWALRACPPAVQVDQRATMGDAWRQEQLARWERFNGSDWLPRETLERMVGHSKYAGGGTDALVVVRRLAEAFALEDVETLRRALHGQPPGEPPGSSWAERCIPPWDFYGDDERHLTRKLRTVLGDELVVGDDDAEPSPQHVVTREEVPLFQRMVRGEVFHRAQLLQPLTELARAQEQRRAATPAVEWALEDWRAEARRQLDAALRGPPVAQSWDGAGDHPWFAVPVDYADDPPRPFLVRRLLPRQGVVLWHGAAKTGKTTILLDAVRSLLMAEPLLGRFAPDSKWGVLSYPSVLGLWAGDEDPRSVGGLMLSMVDGHAQSWEEAEQHRECMRRLVANRNGAARALERVNADGTATGDLVEVGAWVLASRARLVLLDPLADWLSEDDSDQRAVKQFFQNMRALASLTPPGADPEAPRGCCVVVLQHDRKNNDDAGSSPLAYINARGSSAMVGKVDAIVSVARMPKFERRSWPAGGNRHPDWWEGRSLIHVNGRAGVASNLQLVARQEYARGLPGPREDRERLAISYWPAEAPEPPPLLEPEESRQARAAAAAAAADEEPRGRRREAPAAPAAPQITLLCPVCQQPMMRGICPTHGRP